MDEVKSIPAEDMSRLQLAIAEEEKARLLWIMAQTERLHVERAVRLKYGVKSDRLIDYASGDIVTPAPKAPTVDSNAMERLRALQASRTAAKDAAAAERAEKAKEAQKAKEANEAARVARAAEAAAAKEAERIAAAEAARQVEEMARKGFTLTAEGWRNTEEVEAEAARIHGRG